MSIPSLENYSLPVIKSLPENKVDWKIEPSRSALLIHDMQQYFVRFFGEDSGLVKRVEKNIVALRAWAKQHNIPVIYTAQPIEQSDKDRALLNDMWGPGLTKADPSLQKVVPALAPDRDDIVLVKWRYSAFYRSELEEILKESTRDQLIICGIYAHIGCLTTALDAFMRDVQPFMIADAVGDFSEQEHHMALEYVARRCGSVVATGDVLSIGASAATVLSWSLLKDQLLDLIDEEPELFDADENLIDYGLDSAQLMGLITDWQKLGVHMTFEELAVAPSLNGWWQLIQGKYPQLAE
ncbi:isochorismatase family protein [Microbulbifer sp. OS29]|uniref:isochorismatase n=1 Tax=Microbulbifer okhotskensis TaxID=2926617 RepID=A0A9X2ES19_9GAMM|nr:isochorismatase family protein [Microbulbifer okhotskensis]MCO1334533.1 isochorismatase family protein [Microbulbifer okhotskensis]